MKLDPIKPSPPVTKIVFSMNENCVELYGVRGAAVRKRTSIVNKKGRKQLRPLGTFDFSKADSVRRVPAFILSFAVLKQSPLALSHSVSWEPSRATPSPSFQNTRARSQQRSLATGNVREPGVSQPVRRPHAPPDSQSGIACDPPGLQHRHGEK